MSPQIIENLEYNVKINSLQADEELEVDSDDECSQDVRDERTRARRRVAESAKAMLSPHSVFSYTDSKFTDIELYHCRSSVRWTTYTMPLSFDMYIMFFIACAARIAYPVLSLPLDRHWVFLRSEILTLLLISCRFVSWAHHHTPCRLLDWNDFDPSVIPEPAEILFGSELTYSFDFEHIQALIRVSLSLSHTHSLSRSLPLSPCIYVCTGDQHILSREWILH